MTATFSESFVSTPDQSESAGGDRSAEKDGSARKSNNPVAEIQTSVTALESKRLRCKIWVGASAIAAALAVGGGADLRLIGNGFGAAVAWTLAGAFAVSVVVGALILGGIIERLRQLGQEKATEEDIQRLGSALLHQPLRELTALSKRQMSRFECLAVGQARLAFAASMTAAGVGLCVLVGCAVVAVRSADVKHGAIAGVLAAIGSGLSGYLSKVYMRTYGRTTRQLRFYYGQPLVNCYVLHAERILQEASDGKPTEEQRERLLKLSDRLLAAADRAQEHLFLLQAYTSPEEHRLFSRLRPIAVPSRLAHSTEVTNTIR